MVVGVIAELNELINLRRYAQFTRNQPKASVTRNGPHLSKLRGRGMDFAEVRNYQPGDEIRHMEWRVTARTGRPHIKVFQEERERPVILLADFNASMIFGTRIAFKSVIAARLAAMIAWTVVKQGDRVGGLFFSAHEHSEFTPRGRHFGVLPLLASLSHYTMQSIGKEPERPRMLSEMLIRIKRVLRPGSVLVILSDFYAIDEEYEKHLTRLSEHNDILIYHICDRIELAPPKPQQYAITDGRQQLLVDTSIKSINQAYARYCQDKVDGLRRQCNRLGVQYMQVTAECDLPLVVRHSFLRRTCGF